MILRIVLRLVTLLGVVSAVLVMVQPAQAADPPGQVTDFPAADLPVATNSLGITVGPDGNLWFTASPNHVARITPAGAITLFTEGIAADSLPAAITAGPDGNLWFTEQLGDRIGRITPEGAVTEFSAGLTPGSEPLSITSGPDGNLWFTEQAARRVGRITPDGVVTEFPLPTDTGSPRFITAGPDGNLWFTEGIGRIGRITPQGVITEFSAGLATDTMGTPCQPTAIATGSDGNLWFTQQGIGCGIGHITTTGAITNFTDGVTLGYGNAGITAGPDGSLWYTNIFEPSVGCITTTGVATIYPLGASARPGDIVAGRDGNLWFLHIQGARVSRIGPGCPTTPLIRSPDSKAPIMAEPDFTG